MKEVIMGDQSQTERSHTKKKVTGYITVTHLIKKEGDKFASHCPELDVSSFGDTLEEAPENLVDVICLYLNSIEELGLIEEIFKKRGIKVWAIGWCKLLLFCRAKMLT